MTTGKKAASLAGKGLGSKQTTKQQKTVEAIDLSRFKDKVRKKPK